MARPLRLAIVGASARAAAFSALRAGFEVVTADLFADADLTARCPATRLRAADYPEGLADWLASQDVDAWMYTGALENHPELVDRLATIRPLWGNRGDALRRVRDPDRLRRFCRTRGVLFPNTSPKPRELPLDGSWLAKTYRGSSGSGVWALDSSEALGRALTVGAVFHERIDGVPASAVFVASRNGCELLGVTEQLVGGSAFHARAWAYCGTLRRDEWTRDFGVRWQRIGEAIADEFQLVGLFGVDFVLDSRGWFWVLEVNPRFTASVEIVDGDAAGAAGARHAACFGVLAKANRTPPPRPAGKAVLFAIDAAEITSSFADEALAAGDLADIPLAGTALEAGDPVLTILDRGPAEALLGRLKSRAAEVESRLYG